MLVGILVAWWVVTSEIEAVDVMVDVMVVHMVGMMIV